MVESVRQSPNLGGSAVHDQKKSRTSAVDTESAQVAQKTNSAEVSVDVSLSIADKVKSMSSEPPIDIQLVNEIRQKVAEGRYPIDVSAISSKMFESIKNG
jgi:negative regulator of flagellin synthesis FlgM